MNNNFSYITAELKYILDSFGSVISIASNSIAEAIYRSGELKQQSNNYNEKPAAIKQSDISEENADTRADKHLNTNLQSVKDISNNNIQGSAEEKITSIFIKEVTGKTNVNRSDSFLFSAVKDSISTLGTFAEKEFSKMWRLLIDGGKAAHSPFDEIWVSFKNSALKRINEIISSSLWKELISGLNESISIEAPTLWDGIGAVIKTIFPFLGEGGIASKPTPAIVGDVPEAIIPLNQLDSYLNRPAHTAYYEEAKFENLFNNLINKLDEWPRQLQVINNLQGTNNGLKVLNQFLDKYTVK